MAKDAIRVAVVDDELPVRKALARLLSAASFQPEIYGSALEFIDALASTAPDCLIVDIHMPGLSGLDLQRYMKRSKLNIPTIVITAFDDAEIRMQCMSSGALAFFTKPLQSTILLDAVKAATAGARVQP